MKRFFGSLSRRLRKTVAVCSVAMLMLFGLFGQSALAQPSPAKIAQPLQARLVASASNRQPIVAYNIDFGMDLARAEQTIEFYGEELRDIVEQALRNNENHPDSKPTAKNSYQRESALNDVLPEGRSSAFSKDDLTNLRQTQHPRERLR